MIIPFNVLYINSNADRVILSEIHALKLPLKSYDKKDISKRIGHYLYDIDPDVYATYNIDHRKLKKYYKKYFDKKSMFYRMTWNVYVPNIRNVNIGISFYIFIKYHRYL